MYGRRELRSQTYRSLWMPYYCERPENNFPRLCSQVENSGTINTNCCFCFVELCEPRRRPSPASLLSQHIFTTILYIIAKHPTQGDNAPLYCAQPSECSWGNDSPPTHRPATPIVAATAAPVGRRRCFLAAPPAPSNLFVAAEDPWMTLSQAGPAIAVFRGKLDAGGSACIASLAYG